MSARSSLRSTSVLYRSETCLRHPLERKMIPLSRKGLKAHRHSLLLQYYFFVKFRNAILLLEFNSVMSLLANFPRTVFFSPTPSRRILLQGLLTARQAPDHLSLFADPSKTNGPLLEGECAFEFCSSRILAWLSQ
jgi:hypothetical protein